MAAPDRWHQVLHAGILDNAKSGKRSRQQAASRQRLQASALHGVLPCCKQPRVSIIAVRAGDRIKFQSVDRIQHG